MLRFMGHKVLDMTKRLNGTEFTKLRPKKPKNISIESYVQMGKREKKNKNAKLKYMMIWNVSSHAFTTELSWASSEHGRLRVVEFLAWHLFSQNKSRNCKAS